MKIVVAIGGSILLKEYDCKKFHEYSEILNGKINKFIEIIQILSLLSVISHIPDTVSSYSL